MFENIIIPASEKIGKLELAVTDGQHVSVEANPVIVRGVEYRAHIHVFRQADGSLAPRPDHRTDVYVSRKGSIADPSDSAKAKVAELVIAAVNGWATRPEVPGIFAKAQNDHVEREIARNNGEIAELEKQIAELRRKNEEIEASRPR